VNATQKLVLTWLQREGAPLGSRTDSGSRVRTGEITEADGSGFVAYHATREVAAGAVDLVDLRNLTTEVLGVASTVAFESLVSASACNLSTHAGDYLHVGCDPTSPGAAYSMRLRPGAWMGIWDHSGWPISDTNHVLAVANVGTAAIPYDLVLIGRRATA
jgi:hypothetical protein